MKALSIGPACESSKSSRHIGMHLQRRELNFISLLQKTKKTNLEPASIYIHHLSFLFLQHCTCTCDKMFSISIIKCGKHFQRCVCFCQVYFMLEVSWNLIINLEVDPFSAVKTITSCSILSRQLS